MQSISVVIPNYKGINLLKQNFPYIIHALEYSNIDYEVIIADDASIDCSVDFIEQNYPNFLIIKNKNNQGFAKNINTGIQKASKNLVFLLNSDVKLEKEYFKYLLKYFDDSDTFGVMGRIINIHNYTIQDGAKYPELKGEQICGSVNYLPKKLKEIEKNWIPSFFLSGANALIDRCKLQELKGFDEIFSPFYSEDLELSIRAWRLGWNCYYEHKAICRHQTSSTIMSFNKKRKIKIISRRNKFFLHAIHLEGLSKLIWNFRTAINIMTRIFVLDFSYYRGFWFYIKSLELLKVSKLRLDIIFKKNKHQESLLEVVSKIKNKISLINIRKF